MKNYAISEVGVGKYFSHTVFLDNNYILLSPETPITAKLKDMLSRWDYSSLYSEGTLKSSLVIQSSGATSFHERSRMKEELLKAAQHFNSLVEFTNILFTTFKEKGNLPQNPIQAKIKDFIQVTKGLRQYILRYNEFRSNANYVVVHSVATTIIGIIIGQELHLPPHKLIELGVACLLHEIGMLSIPQKLYTSEKILGEQEQKIISTHPILGFKILQKLKYSMNICLAVIESHETIDGKGYPRQLPGNRISDYAKIVFLASSYVAMTAQRPFRVALDGHRAIMELLQNPGPRYDVALVKKLVRVCSIYPVGTFVTMKNDAIGMVIKTFIDKPRSPLVQLVLDTHGKSYAEGPLVDTSNQDYQITAIVPPNKARKFVTHIDV